MQDRYICLSRPVKPLTGGIGGACIPRWAMHILASIIIHISFAVFGNFTAQCGKSVELDRPLVNQRMGREGATSKSRRTLEPYKEYADGPLCSSNIAKV